MEDLTVIITTSYIKSHPSTELIENVINNLPTYNYNIIIVCDGYKISNGKQNILCAINVEFSFLCLFFY